MVLSLEAIVNRWSMVGHDGCETVYVLGAGWYGRRADGRRVSVTERREGGCTLTVTVPHGWDVERVSTHPTLRAAKSAGVAA